SIGGGRFVAVKQSRYMMVLATSCGLLSCGRPSPHATARPALVVATVEVEGERPHPVEAAPLAVTEPPKPPEPVVGERTFAALRALERGQGETVRITWLGDSHTAADFWTGEIRRRLQ